MNVCKHARAQRLHGLGRAVVVCIDCDHTWDEYSIELEFTSRPASLMSLLLLTPRDERTIASEQSCSACGHTGDLHDIMGGCMWHDSEGPCLCEGFRCGN